MPSFYALRVRDLLRIKIIRSSYLFSSGAVLGPALKNELNPIAPIEERFKVMGLCDDNQLFAIQKNSTYVIEEPHFLR